MLQRRGLPKPILPETNSTPSEYRLHGNPNLDSDSATLESPSNAGEDGICALPETPLGAEGRAGDQGPPRRFGSFPVLDLDAADEESTHSSGQGEGTRSPQRNAQIDSDHEEEISDEEEENEVLDFREDYKRDEEGDEDEEDDEEEEEEEDEDEGELEVGGPDLAVVAFLMICGMIFPLPELQTSWLWWSTSHWQQEEDFWGAAWGGTSEGAAKGEFPMPPVQLSPPDAVFSW